MCAREFVSNSVGVCEHTDVNGGHDCLWVRASESIV